eukprot:jgi/Mesvir1/1087/Mv17599-RA.1
MPRLLSVGQDDTDEQAVKHLKQARDMGVIKAYGRGTLVPKRSYTLADLRLNNIIPESILAPSDATLDRVRKFLWVAAAGGAAAATYAFDLSMGQLLAAVFLVIFGVSVDQVANGGGLSSLVLDTCGRVASVEYRERVVQHEAGHLLVAYLVGRLPKAYCLSALDAFVKYGAFNVQAGTRFVDYDFNRAVLAGQMPAELLDSVTCVALAGVCVEYLYFRGAEGGLSDILQMDVMMRALRFSQKKADDQVRWAVLSTITLLRRHRALHLKVAEAMARGETVGACIAIIEKGLVDAQEI